MTGSRIARLAAGLELPLLVTKPANVRYLSGLADSSNAALLVDPGGEATLYSDFRYADAARALPDVSFVQTKRAVTTSLAELLAGRSIAADPDHLSHTSWEALRLGGVEVAPLSGRVEALRAVKDEGELAAIRRAAALSDLVYAELAEERFVGRTERELAWQIDRRFRELGAEGSAFDTMVGAGEMGARPHGEPRDVPIPAGTMVIVDTGCVVDGYRSDCTRTFLTGADERLAGLYALCLRAQLDGLAAVRPGAAGKTSTLRRASRSPRRVSPSGTGTGSGTASGSRSTKARRCGRSRPTCWPRAMSSPSSRGSTWTATWG